MHKENTKMKYANITYRKDYNGQEGYTVEIRDSDGEWGLDSFFPLVRRENADQEEEKNFIHFGMINKISELQYLGYKVMFH